VVVIASPLRGTRNHDCCQVKARQPDGEPGPLRKIETKTSWRRAAFATHRIRGAWKAEGPGSAAADRGLVGSPCGELPERALRMHEEL